MPPPRARAPAHPSLGEYIEALVTRLGESEPRLVARLREVVGDRRARIALDGEMVDVAYVRGALSVVAPKGNSAVDGQGATDRATTLDLLDGRLEVTQAILDGRLRANGDLERLACILQAIELLLDGSTRVPALQELAEGYRGDPHRGLRAPGSPWLASRVVVIDPDRIDARERDMLARLDLLP